MAKKQIKRKVTKKITRRKRRVKSEVIDNDLVIEPDDIFKVINKVQTLREQCTFIVKDAEIPVTDNILRDAEIKFVKKPVIIDGAAGFKYILEPPPEQKIEQDFEHVEEFPDEIIEDGQIFFD